jgi:hypothetical protein
MLAQLPTALDVVVPTTAAAGIGVMKAELQVHQTKAKARQWAQVQLAPAFGGAPPPKELC